MKEECRCLALLLGAHEKAEVGRKKTSQSINIKDF
jgi:hypothetical protein